MPRILIYLVVSAAVATLLFGMFVVAATLQPECTGNTVNVGGNSYTAGSCR